MCRWCERSLIVDQLTAGLSLPARREFSADPDAAHGGGPGAMLAPPVVFRNGTIRTMVTGRDRVDAVAISGTTILAAGSAEEVTAQTGPEANAVDLQGRTLLPGLIDPHHHYTLSALLAQALLNIGYSGFHTKAQALQQLTATAATTPAGRWIAAGFFDNLLQGGDLSAGRHRAGSRHPARRRPLRPRSRRCAQRPDVRAAGAAAVRRPRGSARHHRAHRHGVDGVHQRGCSGGQHHAARAGHHQTREG